jgi:hypothetical protein
MIPNKCYYINLYFCFSTATMYERITQKNVNDNIKINK